MEHGPPILAIPMSASVVRKAKKLWKLLQGLLQKPGDVMKLLTYNVVNDLP